MVDVEIIGGDYPFTYIWSNGKIYSGEYNNDVWSGFGTFMTTPEVYYSGYFKNDRMDGKGAFHVNKKGDLFLSMRGNSMIMLFRPKTNKVIFLKD